MESVIQRLHIKCSHASVEKSHGILNVARPPSTALGYIPQVVQVCYVCWIWRRFGGTVAPAPTLTRKSNEEAQLNAMSYRSLLGPDFGGARGTTIIHITDGCARWPAIAFPDGQERKYRLDVISKNLISTYGAMKVLTLDGGTETNGRDVNDGVPQSQLITSYKSSRQNA